ncbi:hypothetical protein TNCT_86571 [Trichonephila clavata]|uniref:Uncharacterized protein n=1 Tax=Trichonephila clavata TaxID=2740835 RepID=A0A8X6FI01_TRICU|nr:hypothetical protein TNCT_86571 [Trichonephila clavata]
MIISESNQSLHFIKGAVKSTPIAAMEASNNISPVFHDIRKSGVILFQRLCRLPNNKYWRNYNFNNARNLKTLTSGFQSNWLSVINRSRPCLKNECDDCVFVLNTVTSDELDEQFDKSEIPSAQIRANTYEIVERR